MLRTEATPILSTPCDWRWRLTLAEEAPDLLPLLSSSVTRSSPLNDLASRTITTALLPRLTSPQLFLPDLLGPVADHRRASLNGGLCRSIGELFRLGLWALGSDLDEWNAGRNRFRSKCLEVADSTLRFEIEDFNVGDSGTGIKDAEGTFVCGTDFDKGKTVSGTENVGDSLAEFWDMITRSCFDSFLMEDFCFDVESIGVGDLETGAADLAECDFDTGIIDFGEGDLDTGNWDPEEFPGLWSVGDFDMKEEL